MSRPKKRVLRAETWQLARDSPIEDPETEKQIADEGMRSYVEFLIEQTGVRGVLLLPGVLEERVSNVYRLCFERSGNRDLTIVEDFAAHWPYPAVGAGWVSEILFRDQMVPEFHDGKTGGNRLLKALSRGFARAARPSSLKHLGRDSARTVLLTIKPDLEDLAAHIRDLQKAKTKEASRRVESFVEENLQDLEKRYGSLGRQRGRVLDLLRQGKGYGAAVVIAAHKFGVQERSLQARTLAKRAADRGRALAPAKRGGKS